MDGRTKLLINKERANGKLLDSNFVSRSGCSLAEEFGCGLWAGLLRGDLRHIGPWSFLESDDWLRGLAGRAISFDSRSVFGIGRNGWRIERIARLREQAMQRVL
jgi:hypothetical protein